MKLIVDSRTDKVLGCHISATNASEIIQVVVVCLKMGATKADSTAPWRCTHCAEELVICGARVTARRPSFWQQAGWRVRRGKAWLQADLAFRRIVKHVERE